MLGDWVNTRHPVNLASFNIFATVKSQMRYILKKIMDSPAAISIRTFGPAEAAEFNTT